MQTQVFETTVYFTVTDDGKHLATAVSGPCFAVAADTFEQVRERASEILVFHAERMVAEERPVPPELTAKLTRSVRPFAPSRVERLTVPDRVAA